MKLKGNLFLFLIPILVLAFPFSSINAQRQIPEKEKYGGTLRIAIPMDVKSLDSRYGGGSPASHYGFHHLYDRMIEYSEGGVRDVVPVLAIDWKRVDDLTWIVHLRKGVKYHNGKELTAQDVAENLDWKINMKKYAQERGWRLPRMRRSVDSLKSVEALDRYTLKFSLKYPNVAFVNSVLGWGLQWGPIDPEVVEKYGKSATLHPVGTGPFKFGEYVSGSHITFERFDDYWGKRAYVDKVIFQVIPDPMTRLLALQKSEVDIAVLNNLQLVSEAKKDPNINLFLVSPFNRVWGTMWFNFRRWPMNQLKFRQAVAMGVNWEKIIQVAFPQIAGVSQHNILRGSWAENPQVQKLVYPYNPKKAKDLLREVEKEAGKRIPPLLTYTSRSRGVAGIVLQVAANELKKEVGLDLAVDILEDEVLKDKYFRDPKSPWDILLDSFRGPADDPIDAIEQFHSQNISAGDYRNMPGYNNPKVDELIRQGGASYDRKKRIEICHKLEKMLLEDLATLPLFNIPYVYGVRKNIHDLRAHNSAFIYLVTPWNNVWIEKQKK